jgi:hypothetical protein
MYSWMDADTIHDVGDLNYMFSGEGLLCPWKLGVTKTATRAGKGN